MRFPQVAAQLAAVQEAVALQARDVAGLAEAAEEHQAFLRAWRDLLKAQLPPNRAEEHNESVAD
jgi:hypothetical protein